MPGGDGTGPMGMGSMTGRGMGYCAGSPAAGFAGRGGGFGRGGGRGWRRMYYATGLPGGMRFNAPQAVPADAEKQMLEQRQKALQDELEFVRERLGVVEKPKQT